MEVVAAALEATGHIFEFAAAGIIAYVAYRRFVSRACILEEEASDESESVRDDFYP